MWCWHWSPVKFLGQKHWERELEDLERQTPPFLQGHSPGRRGREGGREKRGRETNTLHIHVHIRNTFKRLQVATGTGQQVSQFMITNTAFPEANHKYFPFNSLYLLMSQHLQLWEYCIWQSLVNRSKLEAAIPSIPPHLDKLHHINWTTSRTQPHNQL